MTEEQWFYMFVTASTKCANRQIYKRLNITEFVEEEFLCPFYVWSLHLDYMGEWNKEIQKRFRGD